MYFVTWRLSGGQTVLTSGDREVVARALLHFDQRRYNLYAYVVMDDHVHVVLSLSPNLRLEAVTHSWKSYTAHQLRRRTSRLAPVWQQESFDRIVRDEAEFHEKVDCVAGNPWKRWPSLETYRWVWVKGWPRSAGETPAPL